MFVRAGSAISSFPCAQQQLSNSGTVAFGRSATRLNKACTPPAEAPITIVSRVAMNPQASGNGATNRGPNYSLSGDAAILAQLNLRAVCGKDLSCG